MKLFVCSGAPKCGDLDCPHSKPHIRKTSCNLNECWLLETDIMDDSPDIVHCIAYFEKANILPPIQEGTKREISL